MKKIIKEHLVWVVALLIGMTTMSFKFLESANRSQQDYVWFEADGLGNIGEFIVTAEEPGGDCAEPTPPTPLCAVGMDEGDIEDLDDEGNPISPIQHESQNPSLQKRYQQL